MLKSFFARHRVGVIIGAVLIALASTTVGGAVAASAQDGNAVTAAHGSSTKPIRLGLYSLLTPGFGGAAVKIVLDATDEWTVQGGFTFLGCSAGNYVQHGKQIVLYGEPQLCGSGIWGGTYPVLIGTITKTGINSLTKPTGILVDDGGVSTWFSEFISS
jgi:hypothetical protein